MAASFSKNIDTTFTPQATDHLKEPALKYAGTDFPVIPAHLAVGEALRLIRTKGLGERIIYFYAVDSEEKLVGIVPTRRLLTSMPNIRISEIMVEDVITVPHTATVLEACEMFIKHKFLAFPIVDENGRMQAVIDVTFFTEETVNITERQLIEDIFQLIGFGIEQIKGKSLFAVFGYRFPWLLATMASGTICAFLAGFYEATLAQTLVLAFFITLVLGLGESVSIQSMTVALQQLHFGVPPLKTFFGWLKREAATTLMLGGACGLLVGTIAFVWRQEPLPSLAIGLSVLFAVFMAGIIGLCIPTLLYATREDSKIAAGPITLALTDVATLLFYFNVAMFLL